MVDDDYPMGEDDVLDSTEMNGNQGTVDPSVITLDGPIQSPVPVRKDPVPILGSYPLTSQFSDGLLRARSEEHVTPASAPQTSTDDVTSDEDIIMDMPESPIVEIKVERPSPPRYAPLPYSSGKTGVVYDTRMRFHAEPASYSTPDDIHPEDPRRIHEIFVELRKAGLVRGSQEEVDDEIRRHLCHRLRIPRPATRGEICLVHTEEHYNFIKSLGSFPEHKLIELAEGRDSIYFHPYTFQSATLAAGGAIEACKAVVTGAVRNAIAIIRPPGHHAESDAPSGFCIFNNVPIATRVCQNLYPEKCRKVLILDWDVHHGNGIQHAFYDDPNVLYISLHVYKDATFYPNSTDADELHCGDGPGLGRNVNIPWEDHGMGDGDYLYAFQEVIMPIAMEFDPDLVIISAGFDAADGDMLGGCYVTPAGYAHMTHMLMRLANGRIAVCLEGGYNLRSIAMSALAVTRTLMLEPPERLAENIGVSEKGQKAVQRTKRQQAKYWKCLYPKEVSDVKPLASNPNDTRRLHDVIRAWQSRELAEQYQMSPLLVKKRFLSDSFEHQVLATPNCMEARPHLVIFHDPPDIMPVPDPLTGKVESHNTWLTDVTKSYIDWAIKKGFEVIDVNIPKYVTRLDDHGKYVEADDDESRHSQGRDLATYIWENYIEPWEATQVYFLGIGSAYTAILDMIAQNENCTSPDSVVKFFVAFVGHSAIQSIKRVNDDSIGQWYYNHSLVFVANEHGVWSPDRIRKPRKKYGALKQSSQNTLDDMLVEHRDEVFELLLDMKETWEATDTDSRAADELAQDLRSPPIQSGANTPGLILKGHDSRATSVSASVKSPKLPPMGLFTVSSNRSRSPAVVQGE